MRILVIFSMFLLVGCTTRADIMNRWVGQTEANLISEWGVPDKNYSSGDSKFLTYDDKIGTEESNKRTTNIVCSTTFEILNGRVNRWTEKGDCPMFELKLPK